MRVRDLDEISHLTVWAPVSSNDEQKRAFRNLTLEVSLCDLAVTKLVKKKLEVAKKRARPP